MHPLWCWVFIARLTLGNYGAGCANTVTNVLQCTLLLSYVLATVPSDRSAALDLVWVRRSTWANLPAFLAVGVPAVVQVASEWWFWELATGLIGILGDVPLAAHVVVMNFVLSFYWVFAAGYASAASALVGQAVGARDERRAWCVAVAESGRRPSGAAS